MAFWKASCPGSGEVTTRTARGLVSTALARAAMVVLMPWTFSSPSCSTLSTHWTNSSTRIRVGWSPMSRRKFSAPGSVRRLSCSLNCSSAWGPPRWYATCPVRDLARFPASSSSVPDRGSTFSPVNAIRRTESVARWDGDRGLLRFLAHDVRVEAGGCQHDQRVGLSATVPGVEPVYRRLFAGISVMQPVKHHPAGGFHCGGRIGPSEEFQGALGCRNLIPNGSV